MAPAFATVSEESDPDASADSTESEILVTARRREERLQDIPLAVTALGPESLKDNAIVRLGDLQRAVPALQLQGGSQGKNIPTYTIRSQRNSQIALSVDPSVSLYFAEVAQVRSHGVNSGMFDLASVQVLKGPQGTLFGRNSTGGAIVITPQRPTTDMEGYVQATIGNYDQRNIESAVNIPLGDAVQVRFAGQIQRNDGFNYNAFNGRRLDNDRNESWRVSVRLAPSPDFENNLVVWGFHADENGTAARARFVGPPATTRFPGVAAALDLIKAGDFHTVNNDAPSAFAARTFGLSNTTELHLNSDLKIKNILGYRFVRATSVIDADGLPQPIWSIASRVRSKQWTNELQLVGEAFDKSLDFIIGGYIYREKGSERERNVQYGLLGAPNNDVVNKSKSLFAQGTLRIPGMEQLSVTAGLRQTWDSRQLLQLNQRVATLGGPVLCALTGPGGAALNPCERLLFKKFSKLTYTLATDYKITDDILLYATHRQGYRSGGFNYRANPVTLTAPYRPEVVKDYEVGLKSSFDLGPDISARFNIAAYYQDYRDIQRTRGIVSAAGVYLGAGVENAAQAKVKGVEPELTLNFGRTLTLSGYYAYSKGKYTSYPSVLANGTVVDLTPSPFSGAPIHSGGATATWTLPVAKSLGEIRLIGNIYAQSKTYGTDSTYSASLGILRSVEIPGYQVLNTRVEWNDIAGSNFSAAAYVRNLTDENYFTASLDTLVTGIGTSQSQLGDPRTYGLEVTFRW